MPFWRFTVLICYIGMYKGPSCCLDIFSDPEVDSISKIKFKILLV